MLTVPPGKVVVVMASAAGGGVDEEEEEEEDDDDDDDDDEYDELDEELPEPPPHDASTAAHASMPAIRSGVMRRRILNSGPADRSGGAPTGGAGGTVVLVCELGRAPLGRAQKRLMVTSSMVGFSATP